MKPCGSKPCAQCPFRKKAAPGYLGNDNADHFLAITMLDQQMPCHLTVAYIDPDWKESLGKARACAGAAIFFANIAKVSRDSTRRRLPKSDEVFARPLDFLKHHGGTADGLQDAIRQELTRAIDEG